MTQQLPPALWATACGVDCGSYWTTKMIDNTNGNDEWQHQWWSSPMPPTTMDNAHEDNWQHQHQQWWTTPTMMDNINNDGQHQCHQQLQTLPTPITTDNTNTNNSGQHQRTTLMMTDNANTNRQHQQQCQWQHQWCASFLAPNTKWRGLVCYFLY